jgi:hypothetical protein
MPPSPPEDRAPDAPPSGEEARAFLQERLAFLGRSYALAAACVYAVANLAALGGPGQRLGHLVAGLSSRLIVASAAVGANAPSWGWTP